MSLIDREKLWAAIDAEWHRPIDYSETAGGWHDTVRRLIDAAPPADPVEGLTVVDGSVWPWPGQTKLPWQVWNEVPHPDGLSIADPDGFRGGKPTVVTWAEFERARMECTMTGWPRAASSEGQDRPARDPESPATKRRSEPIAGFCIDIDGNWWNGHGPGSGCKHCDPESPAP